VESANNDDDWVERLKSADPIREQAIVELRDLLVRGLHRSLSQKYGTGVQADDVVQDALIKILSSLESFEGRSRFTTWAMTIATRVGISKLRRKHFKDVSLDSMKSGQNLVAVTDDTPEADEAERQRIVEILKELIENKLTAKQREATQGLLDGLPVEEVARRTNSNRNAVYKLVHDARMRLREGFAEQGISSDEFSVVFA
jgi:RNA polymerase sigma-70 factor (ECF subfamily)